MSDVPETEATSRPDVDSKLDAASGYRIRHVPGSRFPFLEWQAGDIVSEVRYIDHPSMMFPFRGRVSLFHLRGFGYTRDEAIQNARANRNGRNGQ